MHIIDFFPLKGEYRPEEPLDFGIVFTSEKSTTVEFQFAIYVMDQLVHEQSQALQTKKGRNRFEISLGEEPNLFKGGYSIQVKAPGAKPMWTAFDIHDDWTEFPRYGYLSSFSPQLDDAEERIETMGKFHVNGIQYYDWQYRHDQLLPPTEEYVDPLNQVHSLQTVRQLIDIAHKHNMVSMPYLAIYGASLDFWREHVDWGLYSENGRPHLFEDFLGLMDPTYQSPWFRHISAECKMVLDTLAFDGLHVDQYGEPKQVWSKDGEFIDLPQAFVDFINYQKETLDVPVVFNAVGNWPITHLSYSKADFMYIEVWEPTPHFVDLQKIVENARELSGNKPVVIPIYIHQKQEENLLLVDAIINASGGTHLEIGDGNHLLSDPYFPKSEALDGQLQTKLRRYWDFVIAYQTVLGPTAETLKLKTSVPNGIHCISRKNGNLTAVNLIHVKEDDKWTEAQQRPKNLEKVSIDVEIDDEVKSVYWGSPDNEEWQLKPVRYSVENGRLRCEVPFISYWSLLVIETV